MPSAISWTLVPVSGLVTDMDGLEAGEAGVSISARSPRAAARLPVRSPASARANASAHRPVRVPGSNRARNRRHPRAHANRSTSVRARRGDRPPRAGDVTAPSSSCAARSNPLPSSCTSSVAPTRRTRATRCMRCAVRSASPRSARLDGSPVVGNNTNRLIATAIAGSVTTSHARGWRQGDGVGRVMHHQR